MPDSNFDKLKKVLDDLFMFDQADLDFGIYRIINVRRAEIRRFLDDDLLPQVKAALGELAAGDRGQIEGQLREAEDQARGLGMAPDDAPKVKELRAKLAEMPDGPAAEDEVYSHLAGFFRRYYSEGDFISQRRYKEGVYAIPYEGEEVKLHWANADQYYIKSSEQFRDYTFLLGDGRRVHFKLIDADTERNNNRAAAGKDRRFILTGSDPVVEEDGHLVIRFEYRPDAEGRKREAIDAASESAVMAAEASGPWLAGLAAPVSKDDPRPLLRKHLNRYTAKNTFDYFIHKDLGTFLRRELDFYLKNEVMHLDDIDTDDAQALKVEAYLAKLKAIRRIAHKIIDFVAQLEDFQKRLWLKKKFVVETSWCVTLDRIDPSLYPEVAANDAQRKEWVRLFAIDDLAGNLPPYSIPLTVPFLQANPHLPVDTALFSSDFTQRLLAEIDDLDEATDGLLVHSENFQALNLLQARYRGQVKSTYIDPPYNTSEFTFVYKNGYKHSSWNSMMADRLTLSSSLGPPDGATMVAIDDTELPNLRRILDGVFGESAHVATLAIEVNPAGQNLRPNAPARSHDYCLIYEGREGRSNLLLRELTEAERAAFTLRDERGFYLWDNLRRRGGNSRPDDRPNQWFPLYASLNPLRVSLEPFDGAAEIWPIDPAGERRIWRVSPDGAKREIAAGEISAIPKAERVEIVKKTRMPQGKKPKTFWDNPRYSGTTYGSKLLLDIMGTSLFSYPKSLPLVEDCLRYYADSEETVLDYFGGSGTTAHAVINLNREDDGSRRYALVEMGEYFDTVMKPRILKAAYSKEWKDGKPISRDGVSQLIKVIRLESYEDTLNNLRVPDRREPVQQRLLDEAAPVREEYMLRYWVNLETRGSPSLLTVEQFDDPWAYEMAIARGSAAETRPVKVDLVETFNYLLGLRVKHIDVVRGVTMIQGTLPSGEKALVIWRKTVEMDSEALDRFLFSQSINPRDMEFAVIYVNGDNHLENSRRPDETWKVRLIEDEFRRLMFEEADR